MIEVDDIRRTFVQKKKRSDAARNETIALDGVSFVTSRGETHGILGPNGAGKTTLVKILSTILLPTSGRARVAGYDVVDEMNEVRRRIGMVFGGDHGLYDRISARQNLVFWAHLYRVNPKIIPRRVSELLDRVGLTERADEPVERFSRGMRQRLHLARGLVGDPSVLFLDEPTVGMDPIATREFRSLVDELRSEDRSIVLTTHDLREAEILCDRVTVVDDGRIIASKNTAEMGDIVSGREHVDVRLEGDSLEALPSIRSLDVVERVDELDEPGVFRVHRGAGTPLGPLLSILADSGATDIQTGRPSLEEVYVHLIGRRGLAI